ncbi:hypothetical protein QC761_209960 [Podospora bellae-mahoneyi]|uniref:Uncharacterized protein n=1 Tax=Podospora bellae-mahoneyi TaxID=2093777 RepID=A0ABR0FQZ8_9PEZI|nr:hypothetical protein QC761_209960 [Podospora bellae-mahoneyi]
MSNDTKETKHRLEGARRPQRKDSFSSVHSAVLSWTGLQTKIGPKSIISNSSSLSSSSSNSTSSTATQHTGTPSQGLSKPQRRHSHSFGTGWDNSNRDNTTKKKARPASMSRKLSFSGFMGLEDPVSAKARHAKPNFSNLDPKRSEESTKSGSKNGSLEKVNKTAPEAAKRLSQASTLVGSVVRSKSPPPPTSTMVPKSILRVSSPEGNARRTPRFLDPPGPGEQPHSPNLNAALLSPLPSPSSSSEQQQTPPLSEKPLSLSPPLTPLTPLLDSPPASPLLTPARTMSPSTVRFAKATVHRVEVGPGRRFLPVKRKSKSTITYVSPHDPGPQKTAPKTVLKSATKLRRHQENQKAMGRYWMRTEEEEAQWRAEAEARAQEEAERYRNEPSSPVVGGLEKEVGSLGEVMMGKESEGVSEKGEGKGLGKLVEESEESDNGGVEEEVVVVEEEEEEEEGDSSSDSDDGSEAGARCVEEVVITEVIDLTEPTEEEEDGDKTVVELPKAAKVSVEEVPAESPTENHHPTPDPNPDVTEVDASPLSQPPSPPPISSTNPAQFKPNTASFSHLHSQLLSSEKEAAALRARRTAERLQQSLLNEKPATNAIISVHLASHQTLKSPNFPAQLRTPSPGSEKPDNRRRLSQTRSTADLRTFKLPEPATTGSGNMVGQSAMASVATAVGSEIQRSTSPNNSLQLSRGRRERSRNRERGYFQVKKEGVVV